MPPQFIDDLHDPRLEPFMSLKERELARQGGRFIAEGEHVVRRLLASSFTTESVLIAHRRLEAMAPTIPEHVPFYVVPDPLIHQVVGYKFHSGVLAIGVRKTLPTIEQLMVGLAPAATTTLVVCPETNNTENLGMLMRISAGFGVSGMILGEHSCDPFYRQAIRVSMGTVFSLPIVQSRDIAGDLAELRKRWGYELAATVLDVEAEPLEEATRSNDLALLFGGEPHGLSDGLQKLCDRRITIPMKLGTDSLNVAVAAGIFLYHFSRADVMR